MGTDDAPTPTLGHLRRRGAALRIRCADCGHDRTLDLDALDVESEVTVAALLFKLRCTTCGAKNEGQGGNNPITAQIARAPR
jgi:ribosomal protein S27E